MTKISKFITKISNFIAKKVITKISIFITTLNIILTYNYRCGKCSTHSDKIWWSAQTVFGENGEEDTSQLEI